MVRGIWCKKIAYISCRLKVSCLKIIKKLRRNKVRAMEKEKVCDETKSFLLRLSFMNIFLVWLRILRLNLDYELFLMRQSNAKSVHGVVCPLIRFLIYDYFSKNSSSRSTRLAAT